METLNSAQKQARDSILDKQSRGTYREAPNPCPCGASRSVTIAVRDRYDLPITTVLCTACGLMRSDPYYDAQTLKAFYSEEYRPLYLGKETADEAFFDRQRYHGKEIYGFLKEHFYSEDITGKVVLEVGCGAGGSLQYFKEKGNKVWGCDFGEKYLELGKAKGLTLLHGGSETLKPFGPADIILVRHVLEHMPDMQRELRAVRDLLKEDGVVHISVPGTMQMHHAYRGDLMMFLQNAHIWHFTLRTLTYMLERAGFELVYGDEKIAAVYKKGEVRDSLPEGEYRKVSSYLAHVARFKPYYRARFFIWKRGLAWRGAIMRRLKKII